MSKEELFHAISTANKVCTVATGFGGTASVSLKAYETLVESASVADWVAEALKPEATASLRGFAAVAITAIHKNKPSDQNLQDAIPFLAAATTWNEPVKVSDGSMEQNVSLEDFAFVDIYSSFAKDERTSILAPGIVKLLSENQPPKKLRHNMAQLLMQDLARPGDLRKLKALPNQ